MLRESPEREPHPHHTRQAFLCCETGWFAEFTQHAHPGPQVTRQVRKSAKAEGYTSVSLRGCQLVSEAKRATYERSWGRCEHGVQGPQ